MDKIEYIMLKYLFWVFSYSNIVNGANNEPYNVVNKNPLVWILRQVLICPDLNQTQKNQYEKHGYCGIYEGISCHCSLLQ